MDKNSIYKNGFILKNHRGQISDFAYLSLEISLRAFAETHLCFDIELYDVRRIEDIGDNDYPHEYIKNSVQTVIHLHHFFELILKDTLRSSHELLATNAQDNPLIFSKLLKNQSIDSNEQEKIKSIEFSEALKRVCVLIDNNVLDIAYHFLKEHKDFLAELNTLRNRMLHRGIYVLRYEALDLLMVKHAFPIINEIIGRKPFALKMITFDWKPQPLNCKWYILEEFSKCFINNAYDYKKNFLLKEMLRASYRNPIKIEYDYTSTNFKLLCVPSGDKFTNSAAEKLALNEAKRILKQHDEFQEAVSGGNELEIKKCPVCGIESLLVYRNFIKENGKQISLGDKINCTCCSFKLDKFLPLLISNGILSELET